MPTLKQIADYRAATYCYLPAKKIITIENAIRFVNERGFVYFWPIKGVEMPSLWGAVAGNRPVASAHDDPGHVTWGWKDSMLGLRRWYYGKVLRKKATIISLTVAPNFYALSENYGSPDEDYLLQYEQGRLTQEAKSVYETLLREGPLDSVALRKAAQLSSNESVSRFNRALDDLQSDFKILPVGVAQAGAWRYAFVYDVVTRHYPGLALQAGEIGLRRARCALTECYLKSVGAAQVRDLTRLFGWRLADALRAIEDLAQKGIVVPNLRIAKASGEWVVVKPLTG